MASTDWSPLLGSVQTPQYATHRQHCSLPLRIAWLNCDEQHSARREQFVNQLLQQGIEVWLIDSGQNPNQRLSHFQMLILEGCPLDERVLEQLSELRTKSHLPLLVLCPDPSPEAVVKALHSGADGVATWDTPTSVVIARCQALLRRWQTLPIR